MDKLKQWVALTVVGALLVAVAGWFLLVSPKRSEASGVRAQVATVQQSNSLLGTQLATLKSQAKDLPRQQAKLAAVAARIPDNPALPALIRSLDGAAADAGVELLSMSPVAPTAVTAPTAATTAPVAGAVTTTAGTTAAAPTLQVIGVTVNVVGGYFQVEQFLDRLEGLSRAFKVNTFSLTPGDNPVKPQSATAPTGQAADTGKSLTATINGQVFLAPAAAAATATTPVK